MTLSASWGNLNYRGQFERHYQKANVETHCHSLESSLNAVVHDSVLLDFKTNPFGSLEEPQLVTWQM